MARRGGIKLVLALVLCTCAGCGIAPAREGKLAGLGSMRIVYLDMDQNVAIDTHHLKTEIATALVSPLAFSTVLLANHQLNSAGATAMAQSQQVIGSLPFQAEMYAQASRVVQASPWASQAVFVRTTRSDDWDDDLSSATQAMVDGDKDAVLFISPAVYLDNTGQNLSVSFHVTVYDKVSGPSGGKPFVHRYASDDFSYSYHLKLHDPEPSFAQQKEDAQLMANMAVPGALPYWTADAGAQLRKDFEDALPKVSSDLGAYLGAPAH